MFRNKVKNSPFFSATVPLAPPLGGSSISNNLGFVMQHQIQTNWCWAAVSVSTSLFYNAGSGWTTCLLVNQELGQTDCCYNGGNSRCNKLWYLQRALQRTGNLDYWAVGVIAFFEIQQKINGVRPLAVRIGWNGGGGHFVIIDGYDDTDGRQMLSVKDPWYGDSYNYSYYSFSNNYQGSGHWTHSFFTKP